MSPLGPLLFTLFALPFLATSHFHHLHHHRSHQNFYGCLSFESHLDQTNERNIVHTRSSKSYLPVLQSNIRNLRFNSSHEPKPLYIITPKNADHVRGVVICGKKHRLEIRIRSGGHDYEGQSYLAPKPYILLDLSNLRGINISVENKSAWVEAGATLGELYYQISKKSRTLAFPAGICPTIGVGGHISGGGQGTLMRKYGLAADNVDDALIVDVNGRILDRKAMGEDVFWAVRGGGAASFGVIISWKIRLVEVPPKVTVFTVVRTLEQNATKLIKKWQKIAYDLPEDVFIRIIITIGKNTDGGQTIRAGFNGLYLGKIKQLKSLLQKKFPELKLEAKDCQEVSWVESTLYFDKGYKKQYVVEDLLDRQHSRSFFKAKSDFVTHPISKKALESIWDVFRDRNLGIMILDPYGGKMAKIAANETPFPHRAGTLYNIQYFTAWQQNGTEVAKSHIEWINKLYKKMTRVVSHPRTAYLNYKDIDLGKNDYGRESYNKSFVWGRMYFKDNFKRLATTKYRFDPGNYFKNEQSIPPLHP